MFGRSRAATALTEGYRAVGQRGRLARERCLSERVTGPQVVGPARVFVGFRVLSVLSALSGAGLVGRWAWGG